MGLREVKIYFDEFVLYLKKLYIQEISIFQSTREWMSQ